LFILIGWLVIQAGGLLELVVNWQPEPLYIGLSVIYIVLLTTSTAIIVWLARDEAARKKWEAKIHWRGGWLWLIAALILLLWAVPLQPVHPLDALRLLLTSVIGLGAAVTIQGSFSISVQRGSALALAGGMLIFSVLTLTDYPRYYTDEGWNLNKSWSSAAAGPLYSPSITLGLHGVPQRIGAEPIWWPAGLWLKAVGLGLWQGRFFSWLCGALMTAFLYRAALTLYDRRTAALAALFAWCSVLMLFTSHYVRQEVILNLVIAIALYLHARLERKFRLWTAILLGLLLALAVDIHPNAFIYCFAFGTYYLGRALWQRRIDRRLIGLAVGGIFGLLIFLMAHVISDPDAFLKAARFYDSISFQTLSSTPFDLILNRVTSVLNHLRVWYALSLVEASLLAFSAFVILISLRRHVPVSRDHAVVILFGLALLGWMILGTYRAVSYSANLLPLGALIVGIGLARLFQEINRTFVMSAICLAAVAGSSAQQVFVSNSADFNRRFENCLTTLQARLPDSGMIAGEQLFWLARPELSNYASRVLLESPWEGHDRLGWWAEIDPDVVLWPGPITGEGYEYLSANGYTTVDLPTCADFVIIWLKPGIALKSG